MFENNRRKRVEIKLELEDSESDLELPDKNPSLTEQSSHYSSGAASIEANVKELELEKRLKALEQNNKEQQETIKSLTKTCSEVAIKSQALEKTIEHLQDENKQLKKELESKFKSAANSTKFLGEQLRSELSKKTTTLTCILDKHCKELQQRETNFQADLTRTEQQHHEGLLSQYKGLEKKLEKTEGELDGFKVSVQTWGKGVAASGGMVYGNGWRLPSAPNLQI